MIAEVSIKGEIGDALDEEANPVKIDLGMVSSEDLEEQLMNEHLKEQEPTPYSHFSPGWLTSGCLKSA